MVYTWWIYAMTTKLNEYVKTAAGWKISVTGYERIFEESWKRSDMPSLKLGKG